MKFPGRFTSGLILLFTSCGALAQSELDVRIKPSNDALKANIEGYIGGVGDRDEEALLRFSRGAEEQARKAAQALGFYQPQISSDVKGGKNPRLTLTIDPGEPVHLRNVTIRVDGPAASLKGFRVPSSDQLKSGAVLNHGNYDDAKRVIQNQASRYGFFSGRFTRQKLSVDPQAGVADIELIYDSGPRYTLGKVSFAGDTPFDEDLLQRMVPFKSGTPYDSELIAELNRSRPGHLGCDPAVAHLPVMGSFPLMDSDHALNLLQAALPIRVDKPMTWWVTVGPR